MIPLWAKLAAIAALLAGVWGHGYTHGARRAEAKQAAELQAATDAARAEENRRVMRLQEAQDVAERSRQAAQRDAAASRAAVVSLRQQAASYASLPSNPASAACSPSADDRARVLADLLGRASERADELASQADSARIAGQLCVSAYEGLTHQR